MLDFQKAYKVAGDTATARVLLAIAPGPNAHMGGITSTLSQLASLSGIGQEATEAGVHKLTKQGLVRVQSSDFMEGLKHFSLTDKARKAIAACK